MDDGCALLYSTQQILAPGHHWMYTYHRCFLAFDSTGLDLAANYLTRFCLLCGFGFLIPHHMLSLLYPHFFTNHLLVGLVLARVHRYRQQFADILRSSNSGLTTSRFIRLFVLSLVLLVINLPLTFYVFYRNLDQPLTTYDWDLVHGKGWNYILRVPSYDIVQFDRWVSVGAGYILFFVFGMGNDALKMYRGWLDTIGLGRYLPDSMMGTSTLGNNQSGSWSGVGTIGSYLPKRWTSRRQLGSSSNESHSETSSDKQVYYLLFCPLSQILICLLGQSRNPRPQLQIQPETELSTST